MILAYHELSEAASEAMLERLSRVMMLSARWTPLCPLCCKLLCWKIDNTMTIKLIQKRFLNGTREFEIIDDEDAVTVRIKGLLKEEKLTVSLSMLNPEPVVNGEELQFYSNYKGHPVLSLILNNPNAEKFNAFIETLKNKIRGEDTTSAGVEVEISEEVRSEALARNVYEEPPEFADFDTREQVSFQPVNTERLVVDISMLKTYLAEADIKPLLDALETLKDEPDNEAAYQKVQAAFNDLGITQGAVLTYATYLKVLLSNSMQ